MLTVIRNAFHYAGRQILSNVLDSYTKSLLRTLFFHESPPDDFEMSQLHRAVINSSSAELDALLNKLPHSMIDQTDQFGQTAVCLAAARNDPIALAILLKHGANVEPQNNNEICALVESIICGSDMCSILLVRAGCNVNRIEARQVNALHVSCLRGASRDVMELLVRSGADIELPTKGGTTPIMLAAMGNQAEIGKALISLGAEVNKVNKNGERALHFAIRYNSHKMLRILLETNTDRNLHTGSGKTLLHYAAQYGDIYTINILQCAHVRRIDTEACTECLKPGQCEEWRKENSPEWQSTFQRLVKGMEYPEQSHVDQESSLSNDTDEFQDAVEYQNPSGP